MVLLFVYSPCITRTCHYVSISNPLNNFHSSLVTIPKFSSISLSSSIHKWSLHQIPYSFGFSNVDMPHHDFIPTNVVDNHVDHTFSPLLIPTNDDDSQAMGFVQRPVATQLTWRPPAIDTAYGPTISASQLPSHPAHSLLQSSSTTSSSHSWISSMWPSPISISHNTPQLNSTTNHSNQNNIIRNNNSTNSSQRAQRRRRGRHDSNNNNNNHHINNSSIDSTRNTSRNNRLSSDDIKFHNRTNDYNENTLKLNQFNSSTTNHGNNNNHNNNGKGNNQHNFHSVREYNRRISTFARKRDLKGALATLEELDRSPGITRNLFTYNAVINALVMCSQSTKAEEFWQDMHKSGIKPNLVTFNTMLKSCFGGTDQDVNRGFRLLNDMQKRGIPADRVTYNSLINACVSAGKVEDAHNVYEEMRSMNIMPDAYTFCTMAKQARHQCDVSMLETLLVHQLHHHTTTKRDISNRRTNNKMDTDIVSPVAYNTIADAFIRCGYPDRALTLLKRLHDSKSRSIDTTKDSFTNDIISVAPDVQTYNVRLKALRESGAPATEAFATLDEMCSRGLEADHITLLTLADLCCRREEMSLAEGVLQAATDADITEAKKRSPEWQALSYVSRKTDEAGSSRSSTRNSPSTKNGSLSTKTSNNGRRNVNQPRNAKANAALFNSLIRGYSSLEPPNIDKAINLYKEMQRFADKQGFSWYAADSVTYTMLVDVFAKVGDAAGAEQIISEMEAAGRSNVVAYNAYLKANRGNGFQAALSILDRMKRAGLRPDVVTYNTIIDFLSSEENGTQIAEELVRVDMPRNGVHPDLLTFNTLIKGVARSRSNKGESGSALGAAYRWFGELQSRGLKPDEFTYQSMVSACAAAGDAPRALEFFRQVECERAKRVHVIGNLNHVHGSPGSSHNLSYSFRTDQNVTSPHLSTENHGFNIVDTSTSPNSKQNNKNTDWMLLPHPAAYIALMRAFLASGATDAVESVLLLRDEMVARGLELGRTGFTAVADAHAERADFDSVETTLQEMLSKETQIQHQKLSPVHHCIRMKALCNAGRLDEAIAILPEVENADTAVFNVLIFACTKAKDMDRLIKVLRSMEARNIEPDSITSRAMSSMMRSVARNLKTFDDKFVTSITRMIGNMHISDVGNFLNEQESDLQNKERKGTNGMQPFT